MRRPQPFLVSVIFFELPAKLFPPMPTLDRISRPQQEIFPPVTQDHQVTEIGKGDEEAVVKPSTASSGIAPDANVLCVGMRNEWADPPQSLAPP